MIFKLSKEAENDLEKFGFTYLKIGRPNKLSDTWI